MDDSAAKFHIGIMESATDLVALAAVVMDARFAILRLHDDGTVIINDKSAPVDSEKEWAANGFYASVDVRDASNRALGTLTVVDSAKRERSWLDQHVLKALAGHIARLLRGEALFRETEMRADRLQTLVDAIPVAAYVVENGRFTSVNAKLAQTTGYTKDEILSLGSVTKMIAPEEQPFVHEIVRRRELGEQESIRYTTRIRCRDGRMLNAEVHGSTAFIAGRRVLVGIVIDVTLQVKDKQLAHEREKHLRAVRDNVSDVIAILDRRGVVTQITPSIALMLGYSPEELTGTHYDEIVHPDDRERVAGAIQRIARNGVPLISASYRVRMKSGAWKVIESVGTNLLQHPEVRGIVLNIRDITERKALEEHVEQQNRLTSLGRLAAHVAHEFNNVMMGVAPFTEVIRRSAGDDPQINRAVDAISCAITRGKRITTDILRFGRPAVPTLKTVDAREVMDQTLREIHTLVPPNVTLASEMPDEPMLIHADPSQMSQVLINLAMNALDAMRASGGTLTIGVRQDENGCAHFSVADTGEGIPDSDLPFIFEPLFSTKKTGSGLGLSVVWQIVASHHGRVSVASERGHGTTFRVSIPLAETGVMPAPEPLPAPPRRAQGGPGTILVVDDDRTIAEGLRWTLTAAGFDVVLASTGAEAAARAEERDIDLVVLDVNLPDADGHDVYARIASIDPIPVIFTSGNRDEREEEAPHPHSAFLLKPFATEDLVNEIYRLLQSGSIRERQRDARAN